MGASQDNLIKFKQHLSVLNQQLIFDELAKNLAAVANPELLKPILDFIRVIPDEQLTKFAPGQGKLFLSRDTNLAFSFYVGCDYEGNFKVILTPNSKDSDAKPVDESVKSNNSRSGTSKKGKKAPAIDLLNASFVNFYRLTCAGSSKQTKAELEFSKTVDSPYVARYLSSQVYYKKSQTDKDNKKFKKLALFIPYAEKGDLFHICHRKGSSEISKVEKYAIIYGMIAGLRHTHNSVHENYNVRNRDIKTPNMVVDKNNLIQYVDFGSWTTVEKDGLRTPQYCPPEFLESHLRNHPNDITKEDYANNYGLSIWQEAKDSDRAQWNLRKSGARADVWSAGVCVYELLTKEIPNVYKLKNFSNTKLEYLKAMMQEDPEKRCNSDEALNLFIKSLGENFSDAAELKELFSHIISHYHNDYHRTQFLCELLSAGHADYIELLPEEKRKPLDFEKMLEWSHNMTMSEWMRLRSLYQPHLSAEELIKFDQLLKNRPEFQPNLIGASLGNAIRTRDTQVLELIRKEGYDVSKFYKNLYNQKNEAKADEISASGYGPAYFSGNYSAEESKWWSERKLSLALKTQVEAPVPSKQEIVVAVNKINALLAPTSAEKITFLRDYRQRLSEKITYLLNKKVDKQRSIKARF